jgi:hypothetical protein
LGIFERHYESWTTLAIQPQSTLNGPEFQKR